MLAISSERRVVPDWILNHVGFGNGLYLSDAFPEAKRIGLFEWFYRAVGADVDFLKQAPVEPDRALRLRTGMLRSFWSLQIAIWVYLATTSVSSASCVQIASDTRGHRS